MTSMTKLPAQLYVTAKKQPIYDNGVITGYHTPLGFLHAYDPKKPSEKKHDTQREWAYHGYIREFKMEDRNGVLWLTGVRYNNGTAEQIDEAADPQPAIWDNTPLAGFEIVRSVSRFSTSNKLWRVTDPRGFEFEITTGSLAQIIEDATILKGGLIDAKCAWKGNTNLVVVA